MNTNERRLTHTLLASCVAVALVFAAASQARATESASPCVAGASSMDARLAAKADQSFASLRSFVIRTRMIHELNVPEALDRVERYRHACGKA